MASKRAKQRKESPKWKAESRADQAVAWAGVIERLIDKCGLTGAFLIFISIFVVVYASPEQKQDIINLFVLGRGIHAFYPTLVAAVVFVLLLFGQQFYFDRRIRKLQLELARVGQWKSDHQQTQTVEPLHHSRNVQPGE